MQDLLKKLSEGIESLETAHRHEKVRADALEKGMREIIAHKESSNKTGRLFAQLARQIIEEAGNEQQ